MAYIHLFQTVAEYTSARTNNYVEPWLSYTKENSGLTFNKTEEEKLPETPLTFIAQENGTFKFSGSTTSNTLNYSLDGGETWVALAHDTNTPTVQSGSSIMFKGSNLTVQSYAGIGKFISSGRFEVEGNIMSLLYGDNFIGKDTLSSEYTFYYLFSGDTGMTSAENLVIPATTLTDYCYFAMFVNCTGLTTAPALPATNLANSCYQVMFKNCTSLTTAPALPATTLEDYASFYCYAGMFQGCTSLTTAPELPVTTLTFACYEDMFSGCSSLNYIKCLATNISAPEGDCTQNWVDGVQTTSGTFVKNPNMSSWERGVSGIPNNWTVQDA